MLNKHFQIDTNGTLLTGLVSYYKLDDVNDFYGTNHLTNNNVVTFEAGVSDNCAKFNGINQSLSCSNVLSAETINISMAMWVYIPSSSEKGCFMHNGKDSASTANGYSLGVGNTDFDSNGNNLICLLDQLAWLNFNETIGTGWHWILMTRDATTWRGYVDNVVSATTFTTNPIPPTTNFKIGVDTPAGSLPRYWKDKIDEFGFWAKVLSTQERADLYNAGAGQTMAASDEVIATWSYRKSVTLSRSSGVVTDYQMKLLIGQSAGSGTNDVLAAGCKTDFSDLRFTDSDGIALLDYWIESVTGTSPNQVATVWIEFDSIGTGATTFYMYYGNLAAYAVSSGANTFLYFDDFNANTTSRYTSYGTSSWNIDPVNKYLRLTSGQGCYINTTAFTDFELMCNIKGDVSGDTYSKFVEWRTTTTRQSGYYLQWDYAGQGQTYSLKKSGATVLASNATIPLGNTWHVCNVKAVGTSQSVQLGSYTLLAATDATFGSTGKIGFTGDFAGADYGYFSLIRIKKLVVSEPIWGVWGAQESRLGFNQMILMM